VERVVARLPTLEPTVVALVLIAWFAASVCIALAIGRWFKYQRDQDESDARRDWHG